MFNRVLQVFINRPTGNFHRHWLVLLALMSWTSPAAIAAFAQNQPVKMALSNPPKLVATFLPIYLFTKGVTGDTAQVEILIPPGSEVHEYQAKPSDARKLARAEILIKNGLGLEEFLSKLIETTGNSNLIQIDASQGIEPLEEHEEETEEEHIDSHHDHHDGNPHVWLDPVLAQQQVANIRDGLISANPSQSKAYQANASNYLQQLQDLHQQFEQRLSPYRGCTFIAFHDAYPYLAKRYGLNQVAVVEIPEQSITPSDIQKVVQTAKQANVKALITEPGTNNKVIEQIAREIGIEVQFLDPLENGELNPQYYFDIMRKNLQTLETACQ